MKKTKMVTFFAIFATIALITTIIVPQVQAKGNGRTAKRPIEDFFENNFWVYGWADPESLLVIYPHSDLIWYGSEKYIQDHEYSGFILERVMNDGRIEISIHLHVNDVFTDVYYMDPDVYWWPYAMQECYVDYFFSVKFVMDGDPGDPIPKLSYVEVTYMSILVWGEGIITEEVAPFGYTPGVTGKLSSHQLYINTNGQDKWVVEKVAIMEIGK